VGMLMVRIEDPYSFPTSTSGTPPPAKHPIDLDEENTEIEMLPPGIGATFFSIGATPSPTATTSPLNYRLNSVIAFDGQGRIQQLFFTTRPEANDKVRFPGQKTRLINQYGPRVGTVIDKLADSVPSGGGDYTGYSMLLFDNSKFSVLTPDSAEPELNVSPEQKEWLDKNAVALIVSRYNGTIVRGNE
jgi:hypothetical protein